MIGRVNPWRRGPDWLAEASAYVDGELSTDQVVAIERELQRSASLREYVEDLRAMRVAMRAMAPVAAQRSYTLSTADAERIRPGFARGGRATPGSGWPAGLFSGLAGGLATMRLAATFSTVAAAALVAVVVVDLTADEGGAPLPDSRFAATTATIDDDDQAATAVRSDVGEPAVESASAVAPTAALDADEGLQSATAVSEIVEQESAAATESVPAAAARPEVVGAAPVPESAEEVRPDAAPSDDGSPALAAAAPPPPDSDTVAEVVTPLPPGNNADEEDAETAVREIAEGSATETDDDLATSPGEGTGGGLAEDEIASGDAAVDPDELSAPSESETVADEAINVADSEVGAEASPAAAQSEAETAPAGQGDAQDGASATDTSELEPPSAVTAPAPTKPPEGDVSVDELPAGQPRPLPTEGNATPADEEIVPVPSLAAARDDAGIEGGDAAAAAEALLDDDDDDGGLLLALEIVFGVAAGLGLVVALWLRRRTA